jgi:hypothetical protein
MSFVSPLKMLARGQLILPLPRKGNKGNINLKQDDQK